MTVDIIHACCISLEAANDVQTLCLMFLSQQGQKPLCQLFCQFEERAPILVSCTSKDPLRVAKPLVLLCTIYASNVI